MRHVVRLTLTMALVGALASCAGEGVVPNPSDGVIRVLMVGDVMLGRGVADIVRLDPVSVFEQVSAVVGAADVAIGNLESPLTRSPYADSGSHDLRADPAAARLLAAAGFDVMGMANNHAGDGGRQGVLDSVASLADAGVASVGAGASADAAVAPTVVERNGVSVAVVAFDATGMGPQAGDHQAGVMGWDAQAAEPVVRAARAVADLVVVGLHGGAEYLTAPGADIAGIVDLLGAWNVDVVWGHGPHVVHPIGLVDPDGDGRITLVATSLGNFLFDQDKPGTTGGAILELIGGAEGVVAYRVGTTVIDRGRVGFEEWGLPAGDAVLVDQAWWSPAKPIVPVPTAMSLPSEFNGGDVVAAAIGDVSAVGARDLVVAFRRPFSPTAYSALRPDVVFADRLGRSAHLGVYASADGRPRWVAGTLARPVAEVAACDGAIAVGYSTLDGSEVVAAGGWTWVGFGFSEAADLEGRAKIGCVDIDGDGLTEPAANRVGEPIGPAPQAATGGE